MTREELLKEIDAAFERAGKMNGWEYNSFKSLLRLNQLSHFQVFELNWFVGAAEILELVDQLHTIETPMSDFIRIADYLGIEYEKNISKFELAAKVKQNKLWKVKSFNLEMDKRFESRRKRLEPLFQQLKDYGYEAKELPSQFVFQKWKLEATNIMGETETLYMHENADQNRLFVQSNKNDVVCVLELDTSGLIQYI